MKHLGLLIVFMGLFFQSKGQDIDPTAIRYANTIKAEDLKKHLEVLASDSLMGRETATKGQRLAADYIASIFRALNLSGIESDSFQQPFKVQVEQPSGQMKINDSTYKFLQDFYFYDVYKDTTLDLPVVFAGYGLKKGRHNDYKKVDVKGKAVLIVQDNPEDMAWTWQKKYDYALKQGAEMVLFYSPSYENKMAIVEYYLNSARMSLLEGEPVEIDFVEPMAFVSGKIFKQLLGIKAEKLISRIEEGDKLKTITTDQRLKMTFNSGQLAGISTNVLGVVEGSDLKDEYVFITAHYDHLGKNGKLIFNGADDDGSGTSGLLEIAEAFQKAKEEGHGPRRTIVLMAVSGEEKGLLGSEYYTKNPIFPLEKTITDLNVDMIGRTDEHHDHPEYVYLIGSDRLSQDLHDLSENVNRTYSNLELDYTYNDPDDPNQFYYRSDHYNFAKNNIPVIFYFSGVHEDYHKPTDTVEKIQFEKTEKIARLIFHTAWAIANRTEPIQLNK